MIAQRGVVFLWWRGGWCFCGGVFVVVFLWWCSCGGVFVVVFLCWCFSGGVSVVVFLRWCFCAGVLVVVFLWWCFRGGVVVFLWWCFCGGVLVVVFLWWCSCGGVFVLVWWCFCGGVFVVVFLWWCFCGGVFVVVFLWWCFCGGVFGVGSCGGVFVVVFLWWCLCDKPQEEYAELFWQFSHRKLPKWSFCAMLPTIFTEKASKMIVSCEASSKFHRTMLPKWSFLAMLPTIFTERASKTSVSRDASNTFHRKSFQNDRFVRGFLQISQNHASKTSVSRDASDNFHRKNFQNDRFVRGFLQISQNKLPKRAFRAMLPTIFTKNLRFATVSRNRHTDSWEMVHPPKAKCASHYSAVHSQMWQCAFRHSAVRKNVWIYRPWTDPLRAHKNVRFYYSFGRSAPRFYWEGCPTANEICVSLQFWAIDTTFLLRGLTARKWNLRFATVLGDRHHVFSERVDREQMKFAFRYSFGRSTPRFYREGWPRENEICVSLQFWAIDTTFLARGLLSGWPSPSRPAE